jgi:hypothetical protein
MFASAISLWDYEKRGSGYNENKMSKYTWGAIALLLLIAYAACFFIMQVRMQIMLFGVMTIVFCVIYSIVASILIYRLAPKTFKLRT